MERQSVDSVEADKSFDSYLKSFVADFEDSPVVVPDAPPQTDALELRRMHGQSKIRQKKKHDVLTQKEDGNPLLFACPFFKFHPVDNYQCMSIGFTRGADVTQHIRRTHIPNYICAECFESFESDERRDAHTRKRACSPVAEFRSTRQTLHSRLHIRRTGSLYEKWHDLWRSLFPGSFPPDSPYIHGDFRDAAEIVRWHDLHQPETKLTPAPFDHVRTSAQEAEAIAAAAENDLHQMETESAYSLPISPGLTHFAFEVPEENLLHTPTAAATDTMGPPPRLLEIEVAADTSQDKDHNMDRSLSDAPPPDSGYGSSKTHTRMSAKERYTQREDTIKDSNAPATTQSEVDDDETVYSVVDKVLEAELDLYKSELSDALLESIRPLNCQSGQLDHIAMALPSFLRSFALRLGLPGSIKIDKEVMHFVHKYRGDIAKRLSSAAKDFHDEDNTKRPHLDPLSKLEIGRWLQNVTMGPLESSTNLDEERTSGNDSILPLDCAENLGSDEELDSIEDFEPVEGPEEQPSLPDKPEYRKSVFSSAAYRWLLASLAKKIMLSVAGQDFCAALQSTISSCFERHRSVSSRRASECYTMVFRADWNPTAFLYEQFPNHVADIGRLFGEVLTLTGSTTNAQVLPCAEYLRQTWPSSGSVLFRLLKTALVTGTAVSGLLDDGTSLQVLFKTSCIEVEVGGTAASIAEIGEQIAWVSAALRPSGVESGIATCAPHFQIDNTPRPATCTFSFNMKDRLKAGAEPLNGQCWHDMFQNPVLVEGFPIPTRSPRALGLEVPLHILSGLTRCPRVNKFLGHYYLKGFSTAVMAKENLGTEMLWHFYYSSDGRRLPYPIPDFSTGDGGLRIDLNELRRARHIVGWCSEARFYAGAPCMNYDIKPTRLKQPSRDFALEKISFSAGHIVTVGCQFAIATKDSHVRITRSSYYTKLNWISKKYVTLWDVDEKRGWLINGTAALLHLLRASLHSYRTGDMQSVFRLDEGQPRDSSNPLTLGSPMDVLLDHSNLKLELFVRDEQEEPYQDPQTGAKVAGSQDSVKHRVETLYETLEKLIDHNASREDTFKGLNAKLHVQDLLEGWDFADVATDMDPFILKRTTIPAQMKSWVDFTRSIPAITLFGRGFGDIIRASPASTESSSNPAIRSCIEWQTVPKNRHLLCVSVADLCKILARTGDDSTSPITLGDGIIWHNPHEGDLFQKACLCSSGQTSTRLHHPVQEVRSSLQRFTMSKSTVDLALHPRGAVIFGEKQSWFLGRNTSSSDNASQSTPLGHSSTSAQSDSGDASPSVPTETSTSASGQQSDEGLSELAAMTVSPEGSSAKARGKRKASPDGGKPGTKRRLLTRVADQLEKTFHGVGSRGKETG